MELCRSALPSSLTFLASPFTSTLILLLLLAVFNMTDFSSGYLPLILYLGTKTLE